MWRGGLLGPLGLPRVVLLSGLPTLRPQVAPLVVAVSIAASFPYVLDTPALTAALARRFEKGMPEGCSGKGTSQSQASLASTSTPSLLMERPTA